MFSLAKKKKNYTTVWTRITMFFTKWWINLKHWIIVVKSPHLKKTFYEAESCAKRDHKMVKCHLCITQLQGGTKVWSTLFHLHLAHLPPNFRALLQNKLLASYNFIYNHFNTSKATNFESNRSGIKSRLYQLMAFWPWASDWTSQACLLPTKPGKQS